MLVCCSFSTLQRASRYPVPSPFFFQAVSTGQVQFEGNTANAEDSCWFAVPKRGREEYANLQTKKQSSKTLVFIDIRSLKKGDFSKAWRS